MSHPQQSSMKQGKYSGSANRVEGTKRCYECGEMGHSRRECPRLQQCYYHASQMQFQQMNSSLFFGLSGIVPGFNPSVLFRVLQPRARIQSLFFVSGSPTLCPDLAHLFRHRVRIPHHRVLISLSSSASCPDHSSSQASCSGFS